MLARTSPVTKSLRGVYQKAAPPFWIPSVAADFCLDLWQRLRPAWKHAHSRLLSTFLDGVLLVPLLTSMTYVVRWDDAGVDLGEERAHRFDFSVCDGSSLRAVQDVFLEAGLGTVDAQGKA